MLHTDGHINKFHAQMSRENPVKTRKKCLRPKANEKSRVEKPQSHKKLSTHIKDPLHSMEQLSLIQDVVSATHLALLSRRPFSVF